LAVFAPEAPLARAGADAPEPLPHGQPLAFLEKCLERYEARKVKGYRLVMQKQERINGELKPPEVIDVCFREEPHSVYFHWRAGARLAERALYVEGENNGMMLARPQGVARRLAVGKIVERDPDGDDARQSGRYTLKEFGLKKTIQRALTDWQALQAKGMLRAEYLGLTRVKEAGDRPCYTLRRTCPVPEKDGLTEVTLYYDQETWLPVGSVFKGAGGRLLGAYYYRDIQFDPDFEPGQFRRAILMAK
jgi:hypothetical protein